MDMNEPQVAIVIPLYNEEEVFPLLIKRLDALSASLNFSIEVILVDDGSSDNTPLLIQKTCLEDARYQGIILSRNYGHQLAISAGMASVSASEAVMIIDGDLQDPPELITTFYDHIRKGYEVVYAVRRKRKKEDNLKKLISWVYYRLLKSLSEVNIPIDSGDFCMLSRKVNDIIVSMPEQSRFIRGMRTWVGFKQIGVEYDRDGRAIGEPKYTFKQSLKLAYDGIFNFSNVPLKLISRLGVYSFVVSFGYLIFLLTKKIMGYPIVSGFTTTIIAIILFSSVQLICLGVIGEYLSRIYMQMKGRPLYIIKNKIVKKE